MTCFKGFHIRISNIVIVNIENYSEDRIKGLCRDLLIGSRDCPNWKGQRMKK